MATALAAPQTINYDLPGGQAAFTLGAPSAAPTKLFQIVGAPQFAESDTIHVVAAHSPGQHFVIAAPASKPAPSK